jgi:hypothetical protein
MGIVSKGFSLLFVVILAVSILIMVESASAQSIPIPSVPEFTLKYVDNSYDVSPTTTTNPYTGQITNQMGYHIINGSVELSIKNQPFTSFYDSNGFPIKLYYQIRVKSHYDNSWYYFPDNNAGTDMYFPSDNTDYTIREFDYTGHSLEYKYGSFIDYPNDGKVDFQVEAFIGYFNVTNINPSDLMIRPDDLIYNYTGQTSNWSNSQTITIPASSTSPTPAVPEFSGLSITILFISLLSVTGIILLKKKTKSVTNN